MFIEELHVRNFKALHDVVIQPGNVNVFIGPNGAGKSTILEAIGLLSIAMSDKVDDVSLQRKGIRLSTPDMYYSNLKAFERENSIYLRVRGSLEHKPFFYKATLKTSTEGDGWNFLYEKSKGSNADSVFVRKENLENLKNKGILSYDDFAKKINIFTDNRRKTPDIYDFSDVLKVGSIIGKYAVYQPSTPVLRGVVSDYAQIQPVGINGGRLAEAIEEMMSEKDGEMFLGSEPLDDIYDLIDWADRCSITSPNKENINQSVPAARSVIEFHDTYMGKNAKFTAYDASEGALYVLFMICLLQHPKAPEVFAVDNFDQAMNPRLARAVTKEICRMAIEKNKTIFLTTHNPMTLDGLDLNDSRIRLFTTQRSSRTGEVEINRVVVDKDLLNTEMPLSRLWTSGMIGGVPNI